MNDNNHETINYVIASYDFEKHRYVFVYRVNQSQVIIEGMYHELQDYENSFKYASAYLLARSASHVMRHLHMRFSTIRRRLYLSRRLYPDWEKIVSPPHRGRGHLWLRYKIRLVHCGDMMYFFLSFMRTIRFLQRKPWSVQIVTKKQRPLIIIMKLRVQCVVIKWWKYYINLGAIW